MTQPFTLLHISDLHFGQDRGAANVYFDQKLVTEAILEDAAAMRKDGLRADRVLITGDIAFSGKTTEYTLARVWLDKLAKTLGIGPDRFFLVPGNHDVDRGKAFGAGVNLRKTLTHLRTHPHELDDYLKEEDEVLRELKTALWPKLQAYADFSSTFGASLITPERPFALEKLEWAGKPLFLLGLNTCLLSFDGSDAPTNLALGFGQLQRAFEQIPLDALTLVLLHHPPEWLADGGAKHPSGEIRIEHCLNTFLQKRPHLLLSGHVHEPGGLVTHPLHSGGLLHFVAGAAHAGVGETVPHAYAWLRLRAEGIDYFPRAWNPDRQRFQPQGFKFELEKGEDYLRIERTSLPKLLQNVLPPPTEQPKTSPERKAQGLELQKAIAHLKRLEKTSADRESLQSARDHVRQLYRKQQQGHLQAADLVDGRYYLLRVLGHGGFATAWLAEDTERTTPVVLKILHSNLVQQPDRLGRFKRGSALMQQLEHPHILRVLESYRISQPIDGMEDASPHHYVVLEWAEQGDLYQYVLKHHPDWRTVVPWIVASAEALEYAHTHPKRCIHRDIKPHNVLLTADGRVKLTDFDLAKLLDSTFLSSTMAAAAGTAYFSAPEVGEVEEGDEIAEVGPGADIYSLGMTLLFALKGKMISTREYRNLLGEVEKLAVPQALKTVVMRALEVEPADRYLTMRAFREALVQAWGETRPETPLPGARETAVGATGGAPGRVIPLPTLPPGPPISIPPKASSRSWVVGGVVGIALLGSAGFGVNALLKQSPSEPLSPTPAAVSVTSPPALVAVPVQPTPVPVVATPLLQTTPPIPPFVAFSSKSGPRGWQQVQKWNNPSPVLYWKASLDKAAQVGGDTVKPWLEGTENQQVFRVDTSKSFLQCWSPAVSLESLPANQAVAVLCQLKVAQTFGLSGYARCDAVWGKQGCEVAVTPTPEPPPIVVSVSATVKPPDIAYKSIPSGSFTMRSNDGGDDEKPTRSVRVSAFEMSKTEITVAQYRACVEAKVKGCTEEGLTADTSCNYDKKGRAAHPINCVDWNQAKAFAAWVGARLPSEAQWEYAARGAKGHQYPWGDAPEPSCSVAVMSGCGNSTATVCSKTSGNTPTGLCDMAGNVWEWVEDCYENAYTGAPDNGTPRIICSSSSRVIRGGGWSGNGVWLRAAYRSGRVAVYRSDYVGFRVVRVPPVNGP